jgi:DNA-binding beta-propeller fold protein YncE
MRQIILVILTSSSLLLMASDCRGSSTKTPPHLETGASTRSTTVSRGESPAPRVSTGSKPIASDGTSATTAHLPLVPVADVDLPGRATRLDYQAIDNKLGRLVISHMNDDSVVFVNLSDGSVLQALRSIPVARGVAVGDEVGLVFVTSSPHELVLIDSVSMRETGRVRTGSGPDGVAWDPNDRMVAVSDQRDGALSLIADAGRGTRKQIRLGTETGNVVFDPGRRWFWVTVVTAGGPDKLMAVEPEGAAVTQTSDLPGCSGAHGLRLHPDGQSAFIACESNATLVRVDLVSGRVVGKSGTGAGPDVLSIDESLGWLYVAAESGDLTVFDIQKPGLSLIGHDQPGRHSHSVAVDPTTHRVFFPLMAGSHGTPVLRIMRPTGT